MDRFYRNILFVALISAPAWTAAAAHAQPGRYGGGMMGPGYHGFWGVGGWLGLLFWGLILVALVLAIRWLWQSGRRGDAGGGSRAMDILRERYARGEIGKEEFDAMKKDIES